MWGYVRLEWCPKPGARIQCPQRCQRLTRYRPGTIGGPVDGIIVDDDNVAVTGNVDIQLKMPYLHLSARSKAASVFSGA